MALRQELTVVGPEMSPMVAPMPPTRTDLPGKFPEQGKSMAACILNLPGINHLTVICPGVLDISSTMFSVPWVGVPVSGILNSKY